MKSLWIILCLIMVFACFGGCSTKRFNSPTDDQPLQANEPTDDSIKMFYDDRLPVSHLGGSETSTVEITAQQITSKTVGTDNPDTAVLHYDTASQNLIAVGTGTATVIIDGTVYPVRVSPAPISLFMITGHSIGAGQEGNAAQSVVCQPGQAYSTRRTTPQRQSVTDFGIGFSSPRRPEGIDAFSPGGGGVIGEDSALAYQWNRLTGEKVWVLNAAVGGSCINEWTKGQPFYENAVNLYRFAASILSNEVKAGHYIVKNTLVLYHSSANFSYKNVSYTDQILENWYQSMCKGFAEDLSIDINEDGTAKRLDGIGFVPIWTTASEGSYIVDKPAVYYLAACDAYPNIFIAGETMRNWLTIDAIKTNFPAIDYTTQGEPVKMPVANAELFVSDGTHYTQVAYNAAGLELAENIYTYLRTDSAVQSIDLQTTKCVAVKDVIHLRKVGATQPLVLLSDPICAGDYTITVSDHLEILFPFVLKAKKEGIGTLTISKDDIILKTVTVEIG